MAQLHPEEDKMKAACLFAKISCKLKRWQKASLWVCLKRGVLFANKTFILKFYLLIILQI